MSGVRDGYSHAMTAHPHQPSSDEADPEKETTPAGVVADLEDKAEAEGATTGESDPKDDKSAR